MMSTAYISAVNTITGTVNDQICTHVLTYLNPNTREHYEISHFWKRHTGMYQSLIESLNFYITNNVQVKP